MHMCIGGGGAYNMIFFYQHEHIIWWIKKNKVTLHQWVPWVFTNFNDKGVIKETSEELWLQKRNSEEKLKEVKEKQFPHYKTGWEQRVSNINLKRQQPKWFLDYWINFFKNPWYFLYQVLLKHRYHELGNGMSR
jgi:hypothetical protein